MSIKRFLDYDAANGITTNFIYDEHTDVSTFERVQDVEPIIEENKRLQSELTPDKDMRLAAKIPLVLIEKWRKEEGIDVFDKNDVEAVRRKLNSSEYAYLRIWPGKL